MTITSNPDECPILVVDDNKDAADTLVTLLEVLGFSACAAYGGPDALRLYRAWNPQLVFLDIDMPGMDGYETAKRIRSDEQMHTRLVALTARDSAADKAQALQAGFDMHVSKPIAPARLHELAELAAGHR
jgi:CheY-like chemotaxis protein